MWKIKKKSGEEKSERTNTASLEENEEANESSGEQSSKKMKRGK